MVEEFNPSRAIILSELMTREKEKYYHLLLLNNAKFTRDGDGRYIANVRLLAPGVRKNESTNAGNSIVPEKKKKETSNYALIFQERLTRLRESGFITVTIQGNNTQFDYNIYPRFTALIAFDNDIVKPKLRPLLWVMKYIEDIYDSRFAYEKHEVEKGEEGTPSFDLILMIFPVFVVRRLGTNIGLKSLVDSICWDLLYSIHSYRQDYLEIEIFARFLQEYYDHNDLLFFLFVRNVITKSLHINWKNRWHKLDGPGRQPQPLWMSFREAVHITGIVFNQKDAAMAAAGATASSPNPSATAQKELYRDFISLLQSQMVGNYNETTGQDTRRIDITEYLHLSVVGYHQSQSMRQYGGASGMMGGAAGSQSGGTGSSSFPSTGVVIGGGYDGYGGGNSANGEEERYLMPLPGQIIPPTPVPLPPSGPLQPRLGRQNSSSAQGPAQGSEDYPGHYQDTNHNGEGMNGAEEDGYVLGASSQPSMANGTMVTNSFEQLQSDREEEFLSQLCGNLQEMVPQDVYEYILNPLRDQLHQTVSASSCLSFSFWYVSHMFAVCR
jgi:hypothetical protein